ncbi:MAG: hypothetical protein M3203_10520 [Actinomycetota bacterium]|nr:hypothetical protein [Actinomycetota bacterium]
MTAPADRWPVEALATRDIDRVQPNMAAAGERVNDARRHIRSARLLADDGPTLAIAACHDAIRKAITAHMSSVGLRARGGEGAHRIVLEYARHQLVDVVTEDDLTDADDIRKDRSLAEYGDFASRQINAEHVRASAEVAERIVAAVAAVLATGTRGTRRGP